MGSISALFHPDCVAVVGATPREGAVGHAIMANLLEDFAGETVPVTPAHDEVLGVRAVDDVSETDADLAVVATPPSAVLDVVESCGETGVSAVVVITAGFGETDEAGTEREERLRELAAEYDLPVVGPNCLGIASTATGLNATFAPQGPLPGNISFVSQSGAYASAVLDWAADAGIGFADVVSLGNKAVLDATDFLRYWTDDPDTDVVVGYLEDVDRGREFIEVARETTADTPVVLVKAGRTSAGAHAAASHTGALAGSEAAYEAALEQAGILRAETMAELFDAAEALGGQPLPAGDEVAIVTNAGGPGVTATDAVGDSALKLADLSAATQDQLTNALPDAATTHNPVDVLGDAGIERVSEALRIVRADDAVDGLLVTAAPTTQLSYADLAEAIVDFQDGADEAGQIPIAACLLGGDRREAPKRTLRDAGIPCRFEPTRAVDSLDVLREYREFSQREYGEPMRFEDVDRERARAILERVRERDTDRLGIESMDLLDAYGIPMPTNAIVDSAVAAEDAAERIDGDVVMKIVSPDIVHKSDIGGVKVGVTVDEAAGTYKTLRARARDRQPDASILGVQVQAMVDVDDGVETIVGVNRDTQFGPLLLFGLGGVFVEVLEDTATRVGPVSEREARELTESVDAAPLLRGARGRDPVDVDGIVEAIGRLSQLAAVFPAITELDVNPLVALPIGGDGDSEAGRPAVRAVDVAVTVDSEALKPE
ncbi:MAG: acetate--CoA ligase family protein [Halopenitus sp.]